MLFLGPWTVYPPVSMLIRAVIGPKDRQRKTKRKRSMVCKWSSEIFLTSHARQWRDLAPWSIVLTCGIPRTAQCISVTAIEDTSCAVLDVCLGAWRWNHSTIVRYSQLRTHNRWEQIKKKTNIATTMYFIIRNFRDIKFTGFFAIFR